MAELFFGVYTGNPNDATGGQEVRAVVDVDDASLQYLFLAWMAETARRSNGVAFTVPELVALPPEDRLALFDRMFGGVLARMVYDNCIPKVRDAMAALGVLGEPITAFGNFRMAVKARS